MLSVSIDLRKDGAYVQVANSKVTMDELRSRLAEYALHDCDESELELALGKPNAWVKIPSANRDASCDIRVTADRMSALLFISQSIGSGRSLTLEDIEAKARAVGITMPVDPHLVAPLLERQEAQGEVICTGVPPIPGTDGRHEFFVDTPSDAPPTREDGTVDYRDLRKFVIVEAGQVLGRIHPPQPGTPGTDVYGQPIDPPGKVDKQADILGENLVAKPNGEIAALASGCLVQHPDGRYSVNTSLTVDGDVDFNTGDIRDFPGDVLIEGSVTEGFRVTAKGTIRVNGRIHGATVMSAEGDIVVKQGITGQHGESAVHARGDVIARFIESATVQAGKSVIARQAILHSHVRAGRAVVCDEGKGWICGGEITAGAFVQARSIGSQMSTKTVVRVGYDEATTEQLAAIEKQRQEAQGLIEQCNRLLQETAVRLGPNDKRHQQVLQTKEHHEEKIVRLDHAKSEIERRIFESRPCVSASSEVCQGVVIEIVGRRRVVRVPKPFVTYLIEEGVIAESAYRPRRVR